MSAGDINEAKEFDYFLPSEDTVRLLDQIEPYLNARNPERYYRKTYPEDGLKQYQRLAMYGCMALIGSATCTALTYAYDMALVSFHNMHP